MKDNLKDLVAYTHGIEGIDTVKITGTDTSTIINAAAEDKTVVIIGEFKNPIADFIGTFGMPNLSKLKTILGFDNYDENAKINVTQSTTAPGTPVGIHFESKDGDFINDYRFMSKALAEEKVRVMKFRGTTWDVSFEPTIAGILRLTKQQQSADDVNFTLKVEKGDLKMYFGDLGTHSGNCLFHPMVTGTLTNVWKFPVKQFLAIINLAGDKMIRIADAGALEIVIDSGIAKYTYLLPAVIK